MTRLDDEIAEAMLSPEPDPAQVCGEDPTAAHVLLEIRRAGWRRIQMHLTTAQREALERHFQGWSVDEIAKGLGISPSAAQSRMDAGSRRAEAAAERWRRWVKVIPRPPPGFFTGRRARWKVVYDGLRAGASDEEMAAGLGARVSDLSRIIRRMEVALLATAR